MPKGAQGRPRYGADKDEKMYKLALTITESLDLRLAKYCEEQDRAKSWAVRQALDKWLQEQGY